MKQRIFMNGLALFVLITALIFPETVKAESKVASNFVQIIPQIPLDCGIDANTPYKSGSNVVGVASISCATSHSSIRIVAQVIDSTGRSGIASDVTCYNTDICTATAYLSYVTGRTWKTASSGYYAGQNIYYESDYVRL